MLEYVYDFETGPNYTILCAIETQTNNKHQYVLSAHQNDHKQLIQFLLHPGITLIGYNNLRFDAQVCEYLLSCQNDHKTQTGDQIAHDIYTFVQTSIIGLPPGTFPPYTKFHQKQIDLFRIHHFDNQARRTSLKTLQVNLGWENVQDMPYRHDEHLTEQQIQDTINYCWNDVLSTRAFYEKSADKIALRTTLTKQYGIDFTNLPDSSIGEKLFLHLIAKETGMRVRDLKTMRTWRTTIPVKSILLTPIGFSTPEGKQLHEWYKQQVVYETREGLTTQLQLGDLTVHYGTGGVHACTTPGLYEGDIIHDIDVSSFYPNIAIVNDLRPQHLGQAFNDVYQSIYDQRKSIPKTDPRNNAFKLMLNSVFGKSNSEFSFLYDPAFTLGITINGQLLITMLAEKMFTAGIQILQINTDGITVKYDPTRTYDVTNIMNWWQTITGLQLESTFYTKMLIANVNNYMALKTNGELKEKGRAFIADVDWHQDNSMRVVRLALREWFINGTNYEQYINNHCVWTDFFLRKRFNTHGSGSVLTLTLEGTYQTVDVGRTVRYYVSTTGSALLKDELLKGTDQRKSVMHDGKAVTVVNQYQNTPLPNLDREFYIKETEKVLESCGIYRHQQQSLF